MPIGFSVNAHAEDPRNLKEASQALEALLIKQMLTASGAFKGSSVAGSSLHHEMFAEVIADTISKTGGFGLAEQIERSLDPSGKMSAPLPLPLAPTSPHAASAKQPAAPLAPRTSSSKLSGEIAPGARLSSGYGHRVDPIDGDDRFHSGIDLAASEGSPIYASADGTVTRVGDRAGYGNAVEIDHGDHISTVYGHASQLCVQQGERVVKGQLIAKIGHTGRATGSHLHFEVRNHGKTIDPSKVLKIYSERAERNSARNP